MNQEDGSMRTATEAAAGGAAASGAAAVAPAEGRGEPIGGERPEGHGAGSVRLYLLVGVVLAISTVIEVQLPRLLAAHHGLMVAALLVSAFFKAALVALFYMHLRTDSRVYSGILAIAGILVVYLLVLLTFGQLTA